MKIDGAISRWTVRAAATVVLALVAVAGCAGPKRLPPVTGTEPTPRPVVPEPASRTPDLVGVGLVEGQTELILACTGRALVLDAGTGLRLGVVDGPEGRVRLRRSGDLVGWDGGRRSGTNESVMLQPVDPADRVLWDGQEYRGDVLVQRTPDTSGLTLVNNVGLEEYLYGVVPWEIGRHGREKLAALAAQAVAARTYTISHLGSRSSRGFDVYASVMDQVYRGSGGEDELCNEAIDETRGLILRSGGREIEAYYSACCGGVSSEVSQVWPRPAQPYLVSHRDARGGGEPFCADYRYYDWREEWSAARLEEILQRTLPEYLDYFSTPEREGWAGELFRPARRSDRGRHPGRLLDLEILEKTESGRVACLAVRTEAGEYFVRGDRVRWVLTPDSGNPAILRSALFEVQLVWRDDRLAEIAARGRGYGHGIGLCQAGSLAMAQSGYSFEEILSHYYPGARLTRIAR